MRASVLLRPRVFAAGVLAATAIATLAAGPASAATTTGTLNVSMTIEANCTVVTPATLSFGTQGVLSSSRDASGALSLTCSNTTPYNVGLNAGSGTGATVASRKMTSGGGGTVNYVLYRDAARTQVWGNTVATDTFSGTGTGAAETVTVYGRVPSQATPAPGSYTDAVTVTVTF
jgi:spore coat protein U-like protein